MRFIDNIVLWMVMETVLSVKSLRVQFAQDESFVEVVHGLDFELHKGETLAIVGESGSGKSVTALALTQLLPKKPQCILFGEVLVKHSGNLLHYSEKQLQKIRGERIAYIFQNPSTSLNPVLTVGYQVGEAVRLHQPKIKDIKKVVLKTLEKVGLKEVERCYKAYPFELSGGMQQRVMIAIALACKPQILIADEPTTALDVTLQKQIMDLLKTLQVSENLSIILITHNLGLVKNFAQNVLVMFRGKIVERGSSEQILSQAQHPYTQALINCIPSLNNPQKKLISIDYTALKD